MSHQPSGNENSVIEFSRLPVHRLTVAGKKSINEKPPEVTYRNAEVEAEDLKKVISILEEMGVLSDRRACLNLIAFLAEHVGYKCAGQTSAVTVAEFMLMSARVSKLAERLDDVNFD